MENEFVMVASVSDLRDGKGIVRRLDDDEIAIVSLNGDIRAFVNVCPHQHTPLVDKSGGQIAGDELTCPMHGWTFELKSGKCVNESGRLKMLDTIVKNGAVFVKMINRNSMW